LQDAKRRQQLQLWGLHADRTLQQRWLVSRAGRLKRGGDER